MDIFAVSKTKAVRMLFTVGHGTWYKKDRLIEALKELDILLDCRSHPRARIAYYNKSHLEKWVPEEVGIEYRYYPKLGGFSADHLQYQPQLEDKVDVSIYADKRFPWKAVKTEITKDGITGRRGFLDFQWFMTLPNFYEGMEEVIELSKTKNVGMMCAEAWWYMCHRGMLADYALWKNVDTIHLRHRTKKTPMLKLKHSEVIGDRMDRYYPEVIKHWRQHELQS